MAGLGQKESARSAFADRALVRFRYFFGADPDAAGCEGWEGCDGDGAASPPDDPPVPPPAGPPEEPFEESPPDDESLADPLAVVLLAAGDDEAELVAADVLEDDLPEELLLSLLTPALVLENFHVLLSW